MIETGVPLFLGLAGSHPEDDTKIYGLSQPKIDTGLLTAAQMQL